MVCVSVNLNLLILASPFPRGYHKCVFCKGADRQYFRLCSRGISVSGVSGKQRGLGCVPVKCDLQSMRGRGGEVALGPEFADVPFCGWGAALPPPAVPSRELRVPIAGSVVPADAGQSVQGGAPGSRLTWACGVDAGPRLLQPELPEEPGGVCRDHARPRPRAFLRLRPSQVFSGASASSRQTYRLPLRACPQVTGGKIPGPRLTESSASGVLTRFPSLRAAGVTSELSAQRSWGKDTVCPPGSWDPRRTMTGMGSKGRSGSECGGRELPLWLSRLRTQRFIHEEAGSIPGLAQWVKDPLLLQAAVCRSRMRLGSSFAAVLPQLGFKA